MARRLGNTLPPAHWLTFSQQALPSNPGDASIQDTFLRFGVDDVDSRAHGVACCWKNFGTAQGYYKWSKHVNRFTYTCAWKWSAPLTSEWVFGCTCGKWAEVSESERKWTEDILDDALRSYHVPNATQCSILVHDMPLRLCTIHVHETHKYEVWTIRQFLLHGSNIYELFIICFLWHMSPPRFCFLYEILFL